MSRRRLAGLSRHFATWAEMALRVQNTIWFCITVARAMPRVASLWISAEIIQGVFVPVQLWLTRNTVNALEARVSNTAPEPLALWLTLLAIVLIVSQGLWGLQMWAESVTRNEVAGRLKSFIMRKMSMVEISKFDNEAYQNQLHRILTRIGPAGNDLFGTVVGLFKLAPSLVGYIVALVLISPITVGAVLVAAIPATLYSIYAGQSTWNLLHDQTPERRLADYYAGILTSRDVAKDVRQYDIGGYVHRRWASLYWKTRNSQRRLAIKLVSKEQLFFSGGSIVMLLGVAFAVVRGFEGSTLGDFAVLFQASQGAYGGIERLGSLLKSLTTESAFAGELRSFLKQADVFPDPDPDKPEPAAAIATCEGQLPAISVTFQDVTYTYHGAQSPTLRNVSFHIGAGEVVALVGENSAGKTTLVRVMLGLHHPQSGRVLLDGRNIADIAPTERYQMASGIFQSFVRYPLTLQQNVAVETSIEPTSQERYLRSIADVGLGTLVATLRDEGRTLLGPDIGGVDLSGGEWQRVALARALYRDSGLLVLDEPTAALDPLAELSFLESLVKAARGRTLVLVSHRLGIARLADRVLVLEGGRVVENGPHDELIRNNRTYTRLFEAQARWYR